MTENTEIWLGTRSLEVFFRPRSVAMVGATDNVGSAGQIVLENLLQCKEKRRVFPVNPKRKTIFGEKCYPSISDLPETPDLVVVVTPAETVPDIVEGCGKIGNKAVIIISSGFKEIGEEGEARERSIAKIAKKYQIRIVGPNCMGVIRPISGLNTSFIRKMPKPGRVTFLSQSGALGAGILDWAIRRNLGFSAFVSLGSMLDVDFSDAIDFFGEDPETRSIIIYPESLGNVKRFMSAARGFARSKPIVVLKSGRFQEAAKALYSHTGSMVGEDLHYDAIFHRAGVIRVSLSLILLNYPRVLMWP
jgi:acetyltransferase